MPRSHVHTNTRVIPPPTSTPAAARASATARQLVSRNGSIVAGEHASQSASSSPSLSSITNQQHQHHQNSNNTINNNSDMRLNKKNGYQYYNNGMRGGGSMMSTAAAKNTMTTTMMTATKGGHESDRRPTNGGRQHPHQQLLSQQLLLSQQPSSEQPQSLLQCVDEDGNIDAFKYIQFSRRRRQDFMRRAGFIASFRSSLSSDQRSSITISNEGVCGIGGVGGGGVSSSKMTGVIGNGEYPSSSYYHSIRRGTMPTCNNNSSNNKSNNSHLLQLYLQQSHPHFLPSFNDSTTATPTWTSSFRTSDLMMTTTTNDGNSAIQFRPPVSAAGMMTTMTTEEMIRQSMLKDAELGRISIPVAAAGGVGGPIAAALRRQKDVQHSFLRSYSLPPSTSSSAAMMMTKTSALAALTQDDIRKMDEKTLQESVMMNRRCYDNALKIKQQLFVGEVAGMKASTFAVERDGGANPTFSSGDPIRSDKPTMLSSTPAVADPAAGDAIVMSTHRRSSDSSGLFRQEEVEAAEALLFASSAPGPAPSSARIPTTPSTSLEQRDEKLQRRRQRSSPSSSPRPKKQRKTPVQPDVAAAGMEYTDAAATAAVNVKKGVEPASITSARTSSSVHASESVRKRAYRFKLPKANAAKKTE